MNRLNSWSIEMKSLIQKNNDIKVLLADSDPYWQRQLQMVISSKPDINLLHIASTEEEAIRASVQLEIDVIVIDIILNSSLDEGLNVIAEIYRKKALPIIVFSSQHGPEIIIDSIVVGAVNYIKKTNYLDIPTAIRKAYYRQSFLHADVAAIVINEIRSIKLKELDWMLTPTEKEILQLVGLGYRQSIIRELLGITQNTMKSHVRHIIGKFKTRSVREAAENAKRRGLYDLH